MSFPIKPFMKKVDEALKFKYTNLVSALETITVPATGTNNFLIDWGDGTTPERVTIVSPSHEYVDADSYQISITGTMTQFAFSNGGDKTNVTSFDQFGDTGLTDVDGFAWGCINCLTINGTDFKAENMISLVQFARDCFELTTCDVSNWDTSNITNFTQVFFQCIKLTALDVSTWDVSNGTTFANAFLSCVLLTVLDVSSWDISSSSTITGIFQDCEKVITINTDSWDTRNITNCTNAFRDNTALTSSFDQYRWWNRTDDLTSGGTPDPIGTFTNCFTGSTNISNYASIPNNWKGL